MGRIPTFSIVWNTFRRSGTSSSLYVWWNLAVNPSGPGLFLVRKLLIAASTSALVIGLFRVSTSSWFRLGRVQVSRNLSISSVYWFMCIELFVVISAGGLYFCGICGDIPFIVFYYIYLIILTFLFH